MSMVTLDKVLEQVKALTVEEQQQLRDAVNELLARSETELAEDELERRLFEAGLLSEVKPLPKNPAVYRAWKPIDIKGKPLSETIIEERR